MSVSRKWSLFAFAAAVIATLAFLAGTLFPVSKGPVASDQVVVNEAVDSPDPNQRDMADVLLGSETSPPDSVQIKDYRQTRSRMNLEAEGEVWLTVDPVKDRSQLEREAWMLQTQWLQSAQSIQEIETEDAWEQYLRAQTMATYQGIAHRDYALRRQIYQDFVNWQLRQQAAFMQPRPLSETQLKNRADMERIRSGK